MLFRGVEVATKAMATGSGCSTRACMESGFRVDTGGSLQLTGCSSEDDKHGCVAVGVDTVLRADTVAVLRSKSDGFQVYSRCVPVRAQNAANTTTLQYARCSFRCAAVSADVPEPPQSNLQ